MTTRPLTPAERDATLPPFNDARMTATTTSAPPFSFQKANLHFFPLSADLTQLQIFCDEYLNLAPDFAYFRPAMPFVWIMVNYYPKMGLAEGNFSWTTQDEVLLTVPLEYYEVTSSGYDFKGIAQVSPFAFVDKNASQVEGREVYGWPKVQGWLTSSVSSWVKDPRASRKVFELSTHGFHKLYADQYSSALPLLSISQKAPQSLTVTPPDSDTLLNPWLNIGQAVQSYGGLATNTMNWLQTFLTGSARDRQLNSDLFSTLFAPNPAGTNPLTDLMVGNTINLKQIRDAQDPRSACYQAITNAKMEITRTRRSGLLGDADLMRGNLSGGYEVRLHSYPSIPIVETLGLELDQAATPNTPATLKPIMPFWTEVDLRYMSGENVAWRAWDGDSAPWRNNEKISVASTASDSLSTAPLSTARATYNSMAGADFQVAQNPFTFPKASIKVLPLLADPEKLKQFFNQAPTDRQLGDGHSNNLPNAWLPRSLLGQLPPEIGYFEPWGRYVYMIVNHFDRIESQANDFGNMAEDSVMFAVPVLFYKGAGADKKLLDVGYVAPYQYSNNDIAARTMRELYGTPIGAADIDTGPTPWLTSDGPFSDRVKAFELKTELVQAINEGQQFQSRTLFEVFEGHAPASNPGPNTLLATAFAEAAKDSVSSMARRQADHETEFEEALSLSVNLYAGSCVNQFSFKQLRDTEAPNNACYQALVKSTLKLDRVNHQQDLEKPIHVSMYRYPNQPIVESLGLLVESTHTNDKGTFDSLQAIRPFYLNADMRTEDSENVAWRAGSSQWRGVTTHRSDFTLSAEIKRALQSLRDQPQERLLNGVGLAQIVRDPDSETIAKSTSFQASQLEQFEPQMFFNNILSQEWGRDTQARWWQQQQQVAIISELERFIASIETGDSVDSKNQSEEHSKEIGQTLRDAKLQLYYLRRFPAQRLPTYVLRADLIGISTAAVLPIGEHVAGETNPSYWTPDNSRWSIPIRTRVDLSIQHDTRRHDKY